ncbi:acyl carrier protein [Actinoplanes sp. N902-109]|uniref:acyl carrier protein n=1 Tax=Actinoplanes sp. (strain N902-109) TaxID=649831 RepID=UPI0003294B3B|nr:acyl carrier protein [Actinoplanes sp. N902-109]AGL15851.1 Acp [Actinoplanes sp. N902-109]
MSDSLSTVHPLYQLSPVERRDALESMVLERFRTALLMDPAEELPVESGFFDLGLTSLRLLEIRQWLEERLGFGIDTTVLFNRPTIEQLVDYLTDVVPAAATPGEQR